MALAEPWDTLKESLKLSGPILIVFVVAVYVLKLLFEKSVDAYSKRFERKAEEFATRIENIGKTSLEVKRELRGEEREGLVALRVAADKWEYFLQSGVVEYTMMDPAK